MQTFRENNFEVSVRDSFEWKDLADALNEYSLQINEQWEDIRDVPEPILLFLKELATWLADPKSQEIDLMDAIKLWKEKIEAINEEGHELPEIVLVRVA